MKQDEEDKDKANTARIMAWVEKHRVPACNLMNAVGKCILPTAWLELPEDLAARELKTKNTHVVDKSIQKLGKIDSMTNVECVLYIDEIQAAGLNPKNLVFDEVKPKPAGLHFRAIIGSNTITSIQKSHTMRPNNPDYAHIHCSLIVCENTTHNRSLAKAYGALENKIRDQRSGSDTWDCLFTAHASYLNCLKQFPGVSQQKELKKAWNVEKTLLKLGFIGAKGSFDQNMTIAQRTGEVWESIKKIFKNNVEVCNDTGKLPKAPTGVGHFKNMGGIPEEKLEQWLALVVNGEESTKDFASRCLRFKQTHNIREVIIEYIMVIREKEIAPSWQEVCETWPSIGDKTWFDMLMHWCGAVTTAVLTDSIKDDINAKIAFDELKQDDDDENISQVSQRHQFSLCVCAMCCEVMYGNDDVNATYTVSTYTTPHI